MQVHNIDHANAVAFLLAAALLGLACPGQCSVYHGAAAATKTSRPAGGGPHRPGGALPASRLVSLTKSVVATLRYRPRSPGNCEAVFPDHGTPVPTPEGLLDCAITGMARIGDTKVRFRRETDVYEAGRYHSDLAALATAATMAPYPEASSDPQQLS